MMEDLNVRWLYEKVHRRCVLVHSPPCKQVLLMDDLIATGGTLCSGIELVKSCGAEVTECCCMVELKALRGRDRCLAAGAKSVWGFISEELLIIKAKLPDDYVDDGAAH
uniref:adenine phosphoribosyltransferase n=1 Tax=Chrysotila carterae TaxID=13221 RepID=A0A7S4B6I8_CHRCT